MRLVRLVFRFKDRSSSVRRCATTDCTTRMSSFDPHNHYVRCIGHSCTVATHCDECRHTSQHDMSKFVARRKDNLSKVKSKARR